MSYVTDAGVLTTIQLFIREHGYAPTVREIGAVVGLKSSSTVHKHLARLRYHGFITYDDRKSRTIRVVPKGKRHEIRTVRRGAGRVHRSAATG